MHVRSTHTKPNVARLISSETETRSKYVGHGETARTLRLQYQAKGSKSPGGSTNLNALNNNTYVRPNMDKRMHTHTKTDMYTRLQLTLLPAGVSNFATAKYTIPVGWGVQGVQKTPHTDE